MVTMLEQAIGYVTFFDTNMLLALGLLFLTALLISKKPQDWKYLALPITIMWHVVGITPNFMQYLGTGLFWAFSVFRVDDISAPLRTIADAVGRLGTSKEMKQAKKASDLAEKRAEESFFFLYRS